MSNNQRLVSLDVLRGLTIAFMILVNTPGTWRYVYAPLRHAKWHGCTPTDLVFPFFLFIVGVSAAFSLRKYNYKPTNTALRKVAKRTFLIFLIGLALNFFPFFNKTLADLRIMGVLQRIALAYGIGATIILFVSRKSLAYVGGGILLAYWGLLYFGNPTDPYSLEGNINNTVNQAILGTKHLYGGFGIPFDPEGLLGSFPAAVNVIFGYLIGRVILDRLPHKEFLRILIVTGTLAILIANLWNPFFPINKPLWTSSYVLYTCGIASLILAGLYWLIDVKGWKAWSYPFKVYGSNALFAYILSVVFVKILLVWKINGQSMYAEIYQTVFQPVFGNHLGSLTFALCFNLLVWLCVLVLYKKQLFIKL